MIWKRRTVADSVHWEGIGLHTGEPVRMSVHPGTDGIAFRLGSERTPARPENVTATVRSTKIGSVGTVEHLMSAFAGLEITDAEVEVDAPELPGMDGSSMPYVRSILLAGLGEIGEHEIPNLYERAFLQDRDVKVAAAKGTGRWRYQYETGKRWPHSQVYEIDDVVAGYVTEIAQSRTFALAEEVPLLIEHGLGRGLDEDSALILGIEGYKNSPRFDDEPARHKMLDMIGDLYLAGVPLRALDVVGERTGHRTNVQAAALIARGVWRT